MNRYIIERNIPNAGQASAAELGGIATKSVGVLQEMGTDIQWVQSFVTANKVYCVYLAKNAELVREHAKRGGFPVDAVSEVRAVIDPTTASAR